MRIERDDEDAVVNEIEDGAESILNNGPLSRDGADVTFYCSAPIRSPHPGGGLLMSPCNPRSMGLPFLLHIESAKSGATSAHRDCFIHRIAAVGLEPTTR